MTPDRLFPVVLLFACTLVGFAAGAAAGADIHVRVELPEAVVHQGSAAARPEVRVHQVDADLLRDPTALATSGRALLHRGEDGACDGYRLSAVRGGSALEQLGLANGDV
ncbi:MAG: hypothetical protein KC656_12790, partial [Myxococcales bacterium]|nr:hypothetical protein [Myxococcales bacterium]